MFLTIGLCLLPLAAWGAEIVVSPDGSGAFQSIQRAIDAAHYGDVLLISSGVYEESVTLKSGVDLRGAGSSRTVLRSNYGYDPVMRGTAVGSVTIEGITVERSTTILESFVVDLTASQVTFHDCRVSGGQQGGLRSTGMSLLSFRDCEFDSNAGYGLVISGAANATFADCRITSNSSVGLYLVDTNATLDDTLVSSNGNDGIRVEGTSTLNCTAVTATDNAGWGLVASDSSSVSLDACSLRTSSDGNLSVGDSASLYMTSCSSSGGTRAAIEASGRAAVTMRSVQVADVSGDGVLLDDSASLDLQRSEIAYCADDGLSIDSAGVCRIQQATVAYNGGHGLSFDGSDISVTGSIFTLNGGYGLHVAPSSAASRSMQFDHNNVWGNRAGDYSGLNRPSSDTSEPPEFTDPLSRDLSLSDQSRCIESGIFGMTVGATGSPLWESDAKIGLGFTRTNAAWGTLQASIRFDAMTIEPDEIGISWNRQWESAQIALSTHVTGWSRWRTQGSVSYTPEFELSNVDWTIAPTLEILGVLDGAASRGQATAGTQIEGGSIDVSVLASYEYPTGITRQQFAAAAGGFSFSGQAIDLTITDLTIGWAGDIALTDSGPHFDAGLRLVPDLAITAEVDVDLPGGAIRVAGATYVSQLSTFRASLEWIGDRIDVDASLSVRSGQFEDVEIGARSDLSAFVLSAALGVNAENGPRCRLDLHVDTDAWFTPHTNLPPVPAYTSSPFEPEAGERIIFDASGSQDPDGAIDQVWWDFGDGETAIGKTAQHVYGSAGEYTIRLMISDDDGAVTTKIDDFTVREAQTTPVASFTWSAVSAGGTRLQRPPRAGDGILLDASDSYDPNGTISEYAWDLQSDGTFDLTTEDARTVIDPLPAGTWPVTLRVIDDDGNSDAVMHVLSIEALKPPEARFEISPATPAVSDPIRFVNRSVGSDATIVSWEWDFGDGHTSREQEPIHRYQTAGTYAVRLDVRDSEGLHGTATREIVVAVNPELVPIQQVWAVVIGISDYAEVEDLTYATQDAEAMASWLVGTGVPADHIRLLTDRTSTFETDSGVILPMQPATLVNVREALGWLRQVAGRDDLVLIHFSGHGYQGADDNLDEKDGVDEFFVLQDTLAAAKDDTALRDDEFGRFLDRIASEHVLVFFDSCFSGGLSRSLPSTAPAADDVSDVFGDLQLEGRLILSASQEDEDAFESPQLKHGVLTSFLLQGLGGAADLNGDGQVTIWELYEYVRAEVPPFVLAERGESQHPQLVGEGETRVVLAQTHAADAPDFAYCPAVPFANSPIEFRDETETETDSSNLLWDFGDGTSAAGADVVHTYEALGTYTVRHSIDRADGSQLWKELDVTVAEGATVVEAEEGSDRIVISVGRQNGVAIGDRFGRLAASDAPSHEPVAVCEVTEWVDEDAAVCRSLSSGDDPSIGDKLVPIPGPNDTSCFDPR